MVILGWIYFNEVSSMKESHDWQTRSGCGIQRSEDIEEETVFTDCLRTEEFSGG